MIGRTAPVGFEDGVDLRTRWNRWLVLRCFLRHLRVELCKLLVLVVTTARMLPTRMFFAKVFMEISLESKMFSDSACRRVHATWANGRQPQYDALKCKEKSRFGRSETGWFAADLEGLRRPLVEFAGRERL
jgi:hypothetical protein